MLDRNKAKTNFFEGPSSQEFLFYVA